MNEKITKEKSKEFKKSMFNSLNFSLMKKQLFSFIALLALVLVGGNVMGQAIGNGSAPESAYWAIQGSVTTHTITPDGNGTTWTVLIVTADDANIGEAGTAATAGTNYSIATAGTNAAISIRWLIGAGAGNVYAVQATETSDDGNCTTLRRSYVGVFGFDVDVFLMTAADGTGQTANGDINTNSTWCGDVINNTLSGADIAGINQALVNNPTAGEVKETSTFYRVTITLQSAPTGFTLNNLKWRFQYELTSAANVSLYDITSLDGAGFGSDGSAVTNIGGTATAALDYTASNNNWVYVPKRADGTGVTTYNYDFEIGNHNRLGSAQTQFNIRINQVDLEFSATTDYNNGTKMHTATVGATGYPTLADAITGQQQIDHGPATTTITIAD